MTHIIGRRRYAGEVYPSPVRSDAPFLARQRDDFVRSEASGAFGWDQFFQTGSVTVDYDQASASHPGVVRCETGDSSSGRAVQSLGGSNESSQAPIEVPVAGAVSVGWVVRVDALATAQQDFAVTVGFADLPTQSVDGDTAIGMRYAGASGTGNWEAYARRAGADTEVIDTGVAVTTQWVRMSLTVASTGAELSVGPDAANLVLVASIAAASLPVPAERMGVVARIQKSVGNSARSLDLDLCSLLLAVAATER